MVLWRARLRCCLRASCPRRGGRQEADRLRVVIDGLDGDAVEAGNAPFISSLYRGQTDGGGAYFPGSRSVIPAETNPNHTAMMTGALPGKSGIAANAFAVYAPLVERGHVRDDGAVRLLDDADATTSGESPTCPQAETIFESVRRQAGKQAPAHLRRHGQAEAGPDLRRHLQGRARRRRALGAVRRHARGRRVLRGRADQSDHRLRRRPTRS